MIQGQCGAQFEALRESLRSNLESGQDLGASLAVTVDGQLVVDLWGGFADAGRRKPWEADSLVLVMSVTKALTGICANMCIERGLLDPEAPVAAYWPEFSASGKERILVKDLFYHRAGLPDMPLPFADWDDWDRICSALAAMAPAWKPEDGHAYHPFSYGWLVGELIRRVTGRRPNQFLQEEVCAPLGVEAWIGAPRSVDDRIAEVIPEEMGNVMSRRAEVPAANGFTNARSVARILGVLACGGELDGVHLLDRRTIEDATSVSVTGPWVGPDDGGIFSAIRFARGFQLNCAILDMGPNPRAFGHSGGGGALAWADPERRVSFAYTPNRFEMSNEHMYDRANALSRCASECFYGTT